MDCPECGSDRTLAIFDVLFCNECGYCAHVMAEDGVCPDCGSPT